MAAGITYTPIATITASGSASELTFNSISGSYTDLILIFEGNTGTSDEFGIRVNSDSGNNYSSTWMQGGGASAESSRYSNVSFATLNYIRSSSRTMSIAHIQNYSNTTTYKTIVYRTAEPEKTWTGVSLWRNTNAITSVTVRTGNNFSNTTTVTLYGITAA